MSVAESLHPSLAVDRKAAAKPLVGLEITDGAIRWVELVGKAGQLTCTARGEVALAPDQAAGTELQRALLVAGATAKRAAIAVPRHLVILRELELPPGPRHELAAMVALKLERELPFPVAEMALALRVDAALPSGAVRVLAAYVRKESLEKSLAVARAAGLEPVSASVSAIAGLRIAPAAGGAATALVVVGPRMTEIAIAGSDGSMLSRAASAGAGGLDPAAGPDAPGNRTFLDELDRTFKSFAGGAERTGRVAAGSGAPANGGAAGAILDRTFASVGGAETRVLERVARIWLAGPGASTAGLEALVAERFGVPAQPLDPLVALGAGSGSPALAVAAGVAVAALEERARLDFVLPRADWRTTLRPSRTVLAIAAGVAIVLGVFVIPPLHFRAMEAEIEVLSKTATELATTDKELAVYRDRVVEIAPWAGGRSPWLAAIGELVAALDTRKAYFTSIKANDGEQRLTVLGKAVSTSDCTRLRDRIDALPAFEATLRGTSIQADKGGFGIHFTLEVQLDFAKLDPAGPTMPVPDVGAGSVPVGGSGSAAGSGSGSGSDAAGSGSGSGSDAAGSVSGSGSEAAASPGSGSVGVSSSGTGSNAGSGSEPAPGSAVDGSNLGSGSGSGRLRRRDRR